MMHATKNNLHIHEHRFTATPQFEPNDVAAFLKCLDAFATEATRVIRDNKKLFRDRSAFLILWGADNGVMEKMSTPVLAATHQKIDSLATHTKKQLLQQIRSNSFATFLYNELASLQLFTKKDIPLIHQKIKAELAAHAKLPSITSKSITEFIWQTILLSLKNKANHYVRRKIVHTMTTGIGNADRIAVAVSSIPGHSNLIRLITLNGHKMIARSERRAYKNSGKQNSAAYIKALEKYTALPRNKHVIPILGYDHEANILLVPELSGLYAATDILTTRPSTADALKLLKDCMLGATHLIKHGLVLQDIKIAQLMGEYKNGVLKRGLLIDPEGLYLANTTINIRFYPRSPEYHPPEVRELISANKPNPSIIRPAEMVYQFGVCLKYLTEATASLTKKTKQALLKTAEQMTLSDPLLRPTLLQATKIIVPIIKKIR